MKDRQRYFLRDLYRAELETDEPTERRGWIWAAVGILGALAGAWVWWWAFGG